jgi:hypothetical protein
MSIVPFTDNGNSWNSSSTAANGYASGVAYGNDACCDAGLTGAYGNNSISYGNIAPSNDPNASALKAGSTSCDAGKRAAFAGLPFAYDNPVPK